MATFTLNATAASLLGFLHEGPRTGWDLVVIAQERIGEFWSLTQSQVYRELAAMAAAGLIVAGERGPRDRRPYALTAAGREAFDTWAARVPGEDTLRLPFLLYVALGRHIPPARLHAAVRAHRALHEAQLAKYQAIYATCAEWGDDDPYSLATLRFGLAYEQMILDWFATLPPELSGAAEIAPVAVAGRVPRPSAPQARE
ncbi:MAG TPA: PadR family transcriptional regulator [Thermomicrobiales bacterium]|jgi:DNA-binding PadR family transcriptional regulator